MVKTCNIFDDNKCPRRLDLSEMQPRTTLISLDSSLSLSPGNLLTENKISHKTAAKIHWQKSNQQTNSNLTILESVGLNSMDAGFVASYFKGIKCLQRWKSTYNQPKDIGVAL